MRLTPQQRREKLQIYNVAETAREIGVDLNRLYGDIWAERVVRPTKVFNRRAYFTLDEVTKLRNHYTEVIENEQNEDC